MIYDYPISKRKYNKNISFNFINSREGLQWGQIDFSNLQI